MSTWVYYACIDHDPPLVNDLESGQHGEVDEMRKLLEGRETWLSMLDEYGEHIQLAERYTANGVQFFQHHPRCALACVDEYGRWTDLGMGLPAP